jgi:quercetin dioxygenase-like cupin family protein
LARLLSRRQIIYATAKGANMEKTECIGFINSGGIVSTGGDINIDETWQEHPKFKGVYLKHLIKGTYTNGMLSSHMVRINPHAVLEEHVHDTQWELHEVIEGEGMFLLDKCEAPYYPGRMAVIPKGVKHRVTAGSSGLVMLAKFFPALL